MRGIVWLLIFTYPFLIFVVAWQLLHFTSIPAIQEISVSLTGHQGKRNRSDQGSPRSKEPHLYHVEAPPLKIPLLLTPKNFDCTSTVVYSKSVAKLKEHLLRHFVRQTYRFLGQVVLTKLRRKFLQMGSGS